MSASDYFGAAGTRPEGSTGRFTDLGEHEPIEAAPGVVLRAVSGTGVMLSHVTIASNSEAPVHTHDEEQMGVVLSGTCDFELDGQVQRLAAGDVYVAGPGVPHGVRTGEEECVVLDVFAPPRRALLDLLD